jgi:hypothetical protein
VEEEEAVELATYYCPPQQSHLEVMPHFHDFVVVAGGDLGETLVVDQLVAELVRKKAYPLALRHPSLVLHPSPESSPPHHHRGSGPHPQMMRMNVVS